MGLWVSIAILAAIFAAVNPLPGAGAAVQTLSPVTVFTTADNNVGGIRLKNLTSQLTTWTSASDQMSPDNWVHGNLSGVFRNWVRASYSTTGPTELLWDTAKVFYDVNGSAPSKTGRSFKIAASPAVNSSSQDYSGGFPLADTSAGTTVTFMIELYSGTGTPAACDYGRNPSGPRIVAGACEAVASAGKGYRYLLESTRPRLDASVQIPRPQIGLVGPQAAARAVSPETESPVQFRIRDLKTGGSGFNLKINRSSVIIWTTPGNDIRYCTEGGDRRCTSSVVNQFTETVSDDGYTVTLRATAFDPPLPVNSVVTFNIQARDYANNTIAGLVSTSHVQSLQYYQDKNGPTFVPNGGFEDYVTSPGAPADWSLAAGTPILSRDTTLFRTGRNALKMVGNDTTNQDAIQATLIGLETDLTYYVEVWARTGGGSNEQAVLRVVDVTGPGPPEAVLTASTSKGATSYERLSGTFRANGGDFEVWLGERAGAAKNEIVYFDDVLVHESLLANGDFEDFTGTQPDGWSVQAGSPTLSENTTAARTGSALRIQGTAGNNQEGVKIPITIATPPASGASYYVEAWARTGGGRNDVAVLRVRNTGEGTTLFTSLSSAASKTYERLSGTFVAFPQQNYEIWLSERSGANTGEVEVFDDVTVRPNPGDPVFVNGWVKPSSMNPGAINVTGLGGSATLNVTMRDLHMNSSLDASPVAVQGYLYAKTPGGAQCTPAAPAKCLLITPITSFHMVRRATGRPNACDNLVSGSAVSCWEGVTPIQNLSGVTPTLHPRFNVNMTVIAQDVAGHVVTREYPNVFRVEIGSPVIVPKLTPTGFVRAGPYAVSADMTDANPGVDPNLAILRISNRTGSFGGTPAGWTQVSANVYEKKGDPPASGNEFTWSIPDVADGVTVAYQFRVQDKFGNLATTDPVETTKLKFTVDKLPPVLAEEPSKAYRGAPPYTIRYASFDAGAGINETTGKLHFRPAGGTWTVVNLTFANNVASGVINGTFANQASVQYWAEVQDKLGNAVTNGTEAAPKNFTVDTMKPVTTLDPIPTPGADGTVTLTAAASDPTPGSGVDLIVFEGHYKDSSGVFSNWTTVASGTSPGSGVLCLPGGATYEFRAYSIDKAGNKGDVSNIQSVTIAKTAGCAQSLTVLVTDPSGTRVIDADGGKHVEVVKYTAAAKSTFTSPSFISIRIDFSPDDGKHWFFVAQDLENTKTYNWTVNAPSCERCKVNVTATGPGGLKAFDESDTFVIFNGNPTTDYDGNGLFDECELHYFHDIAQRTGSDDSDGDGLGNQYECTIGTDPTRLDTDGDGASDGTESKLGRNPLDANDTPDDLDKRFEQWRSYYLLIPVFFLAVTAVFLLGLARRW